MLKTLTIVITLIFAASLEAADVSGKWVGEMASGNTGGSPVASIYLTIQRNGDAVSGTVAYQDAAKQIQIEKPEIHGDQLTFEVHDNPTRIVTFKLLVNGSTLTGDATSGDRTLKISLARN